MASQVAHFSRAIQSHPWLRLILVVVTVAGVALLPAGSYDASVAAIIGLAGVLVTSLLILLRAEVEDREFLLRLFILGFGVRALLAVFLHFFEIFREMDAKGYATGGWQIAQSWRGEIIELSPFMSGEFYYEVNAFIFNMVGYSPLSVKVINCFLGALTGVFVYLIAKHLFGKRAAVIASLMSAFWPSLVFWSTQNLKEPSTLFFTCVLMWAVLQLHHRISWKYILIILASSLCIYHIRRNHLGLLLFAILSSFLFGLRSTRRHILVALILVFLTGMFLYYGNFVPDLLSVISPASIVYRNRSAWGGGALPLVEPSTKALLAFLPKGVIYFLLGPFPWEPGSVLQAMTIPEMLLWYSLLPFTLYGIVCSIKERWSKAYLILAYVTPVILADAILLGNLGQMYRHRYLIWPLLFIFTGGGLGRFLAKVKSRSIVGSSEGSHEHESCI